VRPVIIGIGGGHSGAGKTSVASLILRTFAGWGAIKYTKTSLYASIIDDAEVLSQEGKDTRKFLDAGAAKVLWVKSPFSELAEALPVAVDMLSHLQGIIVEGNSAVEVARPDIVIFVCGTADKMKDSARKILQMADVVIFRSHKPRELLHHAILFDENEGQEMMQCLSGIIANLQRTAD
jgi:uridine kinase